jgi:hypothetical protein
MAASSSVNETRRAADGKGLVQGPEAESSRKQENDSNLESRQHNQRFAPQRCSNGPDCQEERDLTTPQPGGRGELIRCIALVN